MLGASSSNLNPATKDVDSIKKPIIWLLAYFMRARVLEFDL
jgi:hypothetical protein